MIIFRLERVDEGDVLQRKSILKIFGQQMPDSGALGRGPQHRIPKWQMMRAHGLKRGKQIAVVGGLHRPYRAPRSQDPCNILRRNSGLTGGDVAEFSKALEQYSTPFAARIARANRSRARFVLSSAPTAVA